MPLPLLHRERIQTQSWKADKQQGNLAAWQGKERRSGKKNKINNEEATAKNMLLWTHCQEAKGEGRTREHQLLSVCWGSLYLQFEPQVWAVK